MESNRSTKFIYTLILLFSFSIEAQIIGVTNKDGEQKNDPDNLNDADTYTRDNYIHSGYHQREMDKACKGNEDACQGLDVGSPYAAILGKAYGMIVGTLGSEFKAKEDATASTDGKEPEKTPEQKREAERKEEDKEKKQDYCKYIAIGTEVIAMFQQQTAQTNLANIPMNEETAQRDQLMKSANSHEERADNAKMQVVGWGATTVCYAYYATMGGIQLDWNIGLKLVGSAALLAFYKSEMDKHSDAADKVRALAKKLPGKGDCNPITDKLCYCAQPETKNDVQVCMPQIRKRQMAATSTQVTCLDNKMRADPQCNCVASNTCYDTEFVSNINTMGFGSGFNNSVTKPFGTLTRGELVGANARGGANQMNALARQALRKADKKFPAPRVNLSKKQMSQARLLSSSGVPKKLAATFAGKNLRGASKYNGKFRGGSMSKKYAAYSPGRRGNNSVISFSGGSGLQGRQKRKSGSGFNMNKFMKKKGPKTAKGSVVKFRGKAMKAAQVSKNSSASVFDIISRRYMISGWSRLELQ